MMASKSWVLGLSAWVIQDGDFADLRQGDEAEFGVELGPIPAWTAPVGPDSNVSSRSLDAETRDFVGELLFIEDKVWVMDVGIRACGYRRDLPLVYKDRDLPEVRIGDRFEGRGSFHALASASDIHFVDAPAHRYSWRIDRIQLDTTPWVEDAPGAWVRDPEDVSFRDVARTDAWHDDKGRADYLLYCSLLGGPH